MSSFFVGSLFALKFFLMSLIAVFEMSPMVSFSKHSGIVFMNLSSQIPDAAIGSQNLIGFWK